MPAGEVAGTPAEHSASMLKYTLPFIATMTTADDLAKQWNNGGETRSSV
jgi:hypothetical protein